MIIRIRWVDTTLNETVGYLNVLVYFEIVEFIPGKKVQTH